MGIEDIERRFCGGIKVKVQIEKADQKVRVFGRIFGDSLAGVAGDQFDLWNMSDGAVAVVDAGEVFEFTLMEGAVSKAPTLVCSDLAVVRSFSCTEGNPRTYRIR